MPRIRLAAALLVAALSAAGAARAQVLKDLAPVELHYVILHGEPFAPVGTADVSFRPVDTPRGRRLEVKSATSYVIPREPTPFAYEETASLLCDATGVLKFDTEARAEGDERKNTALRAGRDFQVTTTFQDKKRTYTITSDVRRTNFGMFCAGFLAESLADGDFFSDFPLLYPVGGDHKARQRFREAILPFQATPARTIPTIITRLEKQDKASDRYWNAANAHQILLRMEETTSFGLMIYRLETVNGEPVDASKLLP